MAIFNSYVSLPEGKGFGRIKKPDFHQVRFLDPTR